MKKLLADVDNRADKTPYRQYKIEHGIETLNVIIPLGKANMFEVQLPKHELTTTKDVIQLVNSFGGELLKD